MCPASKSNWQPSASIEALQQRAQLLSRIRAFFHARGVWEVETPSIGYTSVTDPHIESIQTRSGGYCQTSPEYHMKRLVAAGSGSIFQLGKAFRAEESGRLHQTEFTMLEWYRTGFDLQLLMDEVDALLQAILGTEPAQQLSYQACFEAMLHLNPHTCTAADCAEVAQKHGIDAPSLTEKDDWLSLLITHLIEPQLGLERPVFLYDFPASQSALAKRHPGPPAVARRFEVYYKGIELANGYDELTDSVEQRQRFEANNQQRTAMGLETIPLDEKLLNALSNGLPDCAGVALGVDRLVMLALNANRIHDVMSFADDHL